MTGGARLLALVAMAVAGSAASPGAAQSLSAWEGPIAEASARFGIPVAWIERVIEAESAGRTTRGGRPIRSPVGAIGLMQLMPATWQAMRSAYGLGPDPDDPRDNILAGTAYLRAMYDRFGYPGLFAAYNAGPARYADYLSRGRRLPSETVAYVARVAPGERRPAPRPSVHPRAVAADWLMVPRRSPAVDAAGGDARQQDAPGVFFVLGGSHRSQPSN